MEKRAGKEDKRIRSTLDGSIKVLLQQLVGKEYRISLEEKQKVHSPGSSRYVVMLVQLGAPLMIHEIWYLTGKLEALIAYNRIKKKYEQ